MAPRGGSHDEGSPAVSSAGRSLPPDSSGGFEVEHDGRRRPFMRGILVHSLMARGVGFDKAYDAASLIRERFSGRTAVPKDEVAKAVREILGDEPFQEDRKVPMPVDITITGGGRRLPFSKGVLSQSLLAAAIDPNDAFDVAR